MMPVIRINDATFADLRAISAWMGTKTPTETIDQIVKETMERLGMERDDEADAVAPTKGDGAMEFQSAPGLFFTKPLAASVNGKPISNPRWVGILLTMIGELKAKGFEGESLVKALNIRATAKKYEQDGFKFHSALGISVQGQSAPDVWREVERIAKRWSIPVTVEFMWRQNPKAQFPGRTGMLRAG